MEPENLTAQETVAQVALTGEPFSSSRIGQVAEALVMEGGTESERFGAPFGLLPTWSFDRAVDLIQEATGEEPPWRGRP